MAGRIIQFPQRNRQVPPHNSDSLARDSQQHASRIAMQVEEELARQAVRQSAGERIQFAESRTNMVSMPKPARSARPSALRSLLRRIAAFPTRVVD